MDIHRVAYRITFNYFRGSEVPLHEFDLYVRVVTGLLKSIPYDEVIENITKEPYKGSKIQNIRKELAEEIIKSINYKLVDGMMRIDIKDINENYTKTEYEGGFLHGILGRRFVRINDKFYTLEGYDLYLDSILIIKKLSQIPEEEVIRIRQLREKFLELKTWFNMYSENQKDKFFLLLDEDIRRGKTKQELTDLMTTRKIYGRINRDWVDYHKSTENYEEKLEKVLDYTFLLNKLPKSVRLLYTEWANLPQIIENTECTLQELQEQGYLQYITGDDLDGII